jgi:hypothetical protein
MNPTVKEIRMSKFLRKLLVIPALAFVLTALPQGTTAESMCPPVCPYEFSGPCPESTPVACCCLEFIGCLSNAQECWTYCRYIPGSC